MHHILVTGGSGQIGQELSRLIWPEGVQPHFPDRSALDLSSKASVNSYFANREWAGVINCAAYTAVDAAETDVGSAFLANSQGPAWLAEATRNLAIPLVHVSTDYVFDGTKLTPYDVGDPVCPMSVYGASKLAGELAVISGNPRSVVLRTAWVVSVHRANFLKTVLRLAKSNAQLRVVDDQVGCPTSAADIASTLQTIVLRHIENDASSTGIFHFVNEGHASWCELAHTILNLSKKLGGPCVPILPIATKDYPTAALRPTNSRLSTERLSNEYGIMPRPWYKAVSEIVSDLLVSKDMRDF